MRFWSNPMFVSMVNCLCHDLVKTPSTRNDRFGVSMCSKVPTVCAVVGTLASVGMIIASIAARGIAAGGVAKTFGKTGAPAVVGVHVAVVRCGASLKMNMLRLSLPQIRS